MNLPINNFTAADKHPFDSAVLICPVRWRRRKFQGLTQINKDFPGAQKQMALIVFRGSSVSSFFCLGGPIAAENHWTLAEPGRTGGIH